ncbi:hypothetical protein CAC42_3010 [Sphaceloma murrayae]|uniref:Uncharacterized protein n=1 Tax=Sphaceloma murrayae TaxID=2082308 RepID=A0A2K1QRD0_9PEZI|nr:hypothetical protein CAC42_3010 [Sphaceloma murrayae]
MAADESTINSRKRSYDESTKGDADTTQHGKQLRDLPRELRDQVYKESLISEHDIEVSTLRMRFEGTQPVFDPDDEAKATSLKGLNLGLLKADPMIAREAAQVFYSKNKFAFHGHRDWSVAVDWLRSIGEDNRRLLTNIELDVRQIHRAYQFSDGLREGYFQRRCSSRHPLLQCPNEDGTWPEGDVDDVDHTMEDVFTALTDCTDGAKLALHLRYVGGGYPGCFEDPSNIDETNDDNYFSMDLPNLIEAWRAKHSDPDKKRDIDVLWYIWGPIYEDKTVLDIIGDQLKTNGFDIIKDERLETTYDDPRNPGQKKTYRRLKVTMKRRALTGPIIQSDPNPYNEDKPPSIIREEARWNEEHGNGHMNEGLEEELMPGGSYEIRKV